MRFRKLPFSVSWKHVKISTSAFSQQFPSVNTRPSKTDKNIRFRHHSLLYCTFPALRMLGLKQLFPPGHANEQWRKCFRKLPLSPVHTNTLNLRFQKPPLWRAFSNLLWTSSTSLDCKYRETLARLQNYALGISTYDCKAAYLMLFCNSDFLSQMIC